MTVSKDDTIILDGGGDKAIIEDRTEQVEYLCHNHLVDFMYDTVQMYLLFSWFDLELLLWVCVLCQFVPVFLVNFGYALGIGCGCDPPNSDREIIGLL